MLDEKDIVQSILMELPKSELVNRIIRMRAELEEAHLKLGMARVTIAENQSAIKHKSLALRNVMRIVRSLRQTVKRRRKHAK